MHLVGIAGDFMPRGEIRGYLEHVDIRKIRATPRSLRNDLGLLDGLMQSIFDNGVLQPIIVRPIDGDFEIVAGSRRLEACRHLKWNTIPCHIMELTDKEAYELSLAENVQRRTLDVAEESSAFARYVDEFGYGGVSELARRIGKSEQFVSQRIRLLDLPRELIEKLTTREVTLSQLREMVGLPEEDRQNILNVVISERMSSRQVHSIVKHIKKNQGENETMPGKASGLAVLQNLQIQKSERALGKSALALQICLMRIDEVIDHFMDDDLLIRETLMLQRTVIHQQIDSTLRLKKKISRLSYNFLM
ncbi:MAG: ParB/RepB/Spo0J family partition protein [Thaumarchaeota archaeon]|nr:ParB/RepB/Spo0J family partition protein [Nitrososphaerota archaeon]